MVNVFGERSFTIGRKFNLLTEEYYDLALIEAKKRDQERDEAIKAGTVDKLGAFHGIPISIKDHVNHLN